MLVKLAAFLSSLSWPGEVSDLGPGGISYIELLILYERWAGERLRAEDFLPKFRRPGRPISVSVAPLCPDTDIWKLCRFLGNMLRALANLPGGLGRFIPGRIGANHGRLRHVGWEKCCHGLTCGPLESSGEGFLSDFLGLLGYPSGSGQALLDGTLHLRYHSFPFARRKPTWRLPVEGKVFLVLADFEKGLVPWMMHVLVVLGVGIFGINVSKGSDLLRNPQDIWFPMCQHRQFLMHVCRTLSGISLLGMGGWWSGEFVGIPVLGADWIRRELADHRL